MEQRGLWDCLRYMAKTGRAVDNPRLDTSPAWHDFANSLLADLATVTRRSTRAMATNVLFIEKCCIITEIMKANAMITPLLGHDIFQMPLMYPDSEPDDWFPRIHTRRDGNPWQTHEGLVISMFGDSTYRWTKSSGIRGGPYKDKVAREMLDKPSSGTI